MDNDEKIMNELINSLDEINTDIWEVNLDSFIDDDIIKEIPVLKTVHNVFKLGKTIQNAIFMKKLYIFIRNLPNASDRDKEYFLQKYKNDETKFVEKLLEIIDNIDDSDKCSYEGKIFEKYFYGNITFEEFIDFSYSLAKIGIDDIKKCYEIKQKNILNTDGMLEVPREIGGELLSAGMTEILTCVGTCGFVLNNKGYKFLYSIFE